MLSLATRSVARSVRPAFQPAVFATSKRAFSGYVGQVVKDEDLVKQSDDWVIEETNFCLGRMSALRYRETDDLARRIKRLIESQRVRMHTRLRDGTCIPYTGLTIVDITDRPVPFHTFQEPPLIKWTWDECYDEAFDDEPAKEIPQAKKK